MQDRFLEIVQRGGDDHPLVKAFKSKTILHAKFTKAYEELATRLQYAPRGVILLIIGPTGWGKSALRRKLIADLAKAARILGRPNARIVSISLPAPQRPFHWDKDLFNPIIYALQEPCPDYKIDIDSLRREIQQHGPSASRGTPRGVEMLAPRKVALNALEARGVIVLILDDVHVIRRAATGAGVYDNYNTFRSFGDAASSRIVGFATSEIKDLYGRVGQNSRRVFPLPCDAYSWEETDINDYAAGVKSIEAVSPFKFAFSLDDKLLEIKATSLSLFGITHEWMQRAVGYVAISGRAKKIHWEDMQATALLLEQQAGILKEIAEFRDCLDKLRKAEEFEKAGSEEAGARARRAGNRKPGVRNPVRDPVGGS